MRYQLQTENQAGLNEIAKCMGESSGPGIHLVFSFSLLQEKMLFILYSYWIDGEDSIVSLSKGKFIGSGWQDELSVGSGLLLKSL